MFGTKRHRKPCRAMGSAGDLPGDVATSTLKRALKNYGPFQVYSAKPESAEHGSHFNEHVGPTVPLQRSRMAWWVARAQHRCTGRSRLGLFG